ncbi:hypothetical protein GY45DRAFT_1330685 [Cubamyces sp. BRFM 1775]|nr:hypothetical protein GY45DRAFT_1330685 [Cubamyces sp. BRFM 1775]
MKHLAAFAHGTLAFTLLAAATTALGATTTITLPDPTTTSSAPSTTPTSITAAACRANLECCEVVEVPPTVTPPIIGGPGLPPTLPPLQGPFIGIKCSFFSPVGNICSSGLTPVCCNTVYTDGILADGCVYVVDSQ